MRDVRMQALCNVYALVRTLRWPPVVSSSFHHPIASGPLGLVSTLKSFGVSEFDGTLCHSATSLTAEMRKILAGDSVPISTPSSESSIRTKRTRAPVASHSATDTLSAPFIYHVQSLLMVHDHLFFVSVCLPAVICAHVIIRTATHGQ
jgi:hypothetical protein